MISPWLSGGFKSKGSRISPHVLRVSQSGAFVRNGGAESPSTLAACTLESSQQDMQEVRELGDGLPPASGVSARDLLHAAVARRHGLSQVVTTDRGFDSVPGIAQVNPRGLA